MDIQSKESLSIHPSIAAGLKLIHYRFLMYSISGLIFDNAIQESRHKCAADIFFFFLPRGSLLSSCGPSVLGRLTLLVVLIHTYIDSYMYIYSKRVEGKGAHQIDPFGFFFFFCWLTTIIGRYETWVYIQAGRKSSAHSSHTIKRGGIEINVAARSALCPLWISDDSLC